MSDTHESPRCQVLWSDSRKRLSLVFVCVWVCVCVFNTSSAWALARLSWFLGIFLQASLRHRPCSRPSDVGSEPCRTASLGAGRRLLADGRALFCFSARLQSTLLKYTSPNCSICTNNIISTVTVTHHIRGLLPIAPPLVMNNNSY